MFAVSPLFTVSQVICSSCRTLKDACLWHQKQVCPASLYFYNSAGTSVCLCESVVNFQSIWTHFNREIIAGTQFFSDQVTS